MHKVFPCYCRVRERGWACMVRNLLVFIPKRLSPGLNPKDYDDLHAALLKSHHPHLRARAPLQRGCLHDGNDGGRIIAKDA
uniref:Uncharacterized protein n=1 Tax=Solanum lycopersicum TaxID=4081 RepID=A0A3Q7IQU0_SOLLC